jgi:hypothetical protein
MDIHELWEELCLISGLKPGRGFRFLCRDDDKCLDMLVGYLDDFNQEIGGTHLREQLRSILVLLDRIQHAIPDSNPDQYARIRKIYPRKSPYLPLKDEDEEDRVIAIGTFDQEGNSIRGENTLLPRGYVSFYKLFRHQLITLQQVTTRIVAEEWCGGQFCAVGWEQRQSISTNASGARKSPNLFCLYKPYCYLQAWIDRDSLPPRQTAFPVEPEMSFEGEFYEIVNTHREARSTFVLLTGDLNRFKFVGRGYRHATVDRL